MKTIPLNEKSTLEEIRTRFDAPLVLDLVAGAVLHHLREEKDWAFRKIHGWLKPGGRLYVADLITFDQPDVQA